MATERPGGPLARGIEPTEPGEDTGRCIAGERLLDR
jgi:hypothetical protein